MLTKNTVLSWLRNHPVATIATLSADNKPKMSVVYTFVDTDYQCYFVTKETTIKYQNLRKNSAISLSWCDQKNLTKCEVNGVAHLVQSGEEVVAAITHLQKIMINQKAEYWTPPVGQIEGTQYIIFRVVPSQVTYADYSAATKLDSKPQRLEFSP